MQSRLRDEDITHYVLNELEPHERLYVESMMLGSDESREDTEQMLETALLLEEGMEAELNGLDLRLDGERRSQIFLQQPGQIWEGVWRVAATAAALAACVAFAVAAPVITKLAFRSDSSKAQAARQSSSTDFVLGEEDPAAFPVAMVENPDSNSLPSGFDDFPTRVLLPTGAVNFADMPMPYLGGDAN